MGTFAIVASLSKADSIARLEPSPYHGKSILELRTLHIISILEGVHHERCNNGQCMGNASGNTLRRSTAAYLGVGNMFVRVVYNIGKARRRRLFFHSRPWHGLVSL
jgi:hypothetical protein